MNIFNYFRHIKKGKKLNNKLYKDTKKIDRKYFARVTKSYEKILNEWLADYNEINLTKEEQILKKLRHKYRIYLSVKEIKRILKKKNYTNAIDTGDLNPLSLLLRQEFNELSWENTPWDLREEWPIETNSIDLITSFEVLEHLSDVYEEGSIQAGFYKTGLHAMLKESYRVLKPGGTMFITTPNKNGMNLLKQSFENRIAMLTTLHVREYNRYELSHAYKEVGFTIRNLRTVHCLTVKDEPNVDYSMYYSALLLCDGEVENRGDDIFLIAEKPLD